MHDWHHLHYRHVNSSPNNNCTIVIKDLITLNTGSHLLQFKTLRQRLSIFTRHLYCPFHTRSYAQSANLQYPHGECESKWAYHYFNQTEYSKTKCHLDDKSAHIADKCDCKDFYMPDQDAKPFCSLDAYLRCLKEEQSKLGLGAPKHLYDRLCPSIGWSVGLLVG